MSTIAKGLNDDVTDSHAGFFRIAPAWEMVFARTFGTRYVQINEGMTIEYYVWRGRMYIVDVTGSYDEADRAKEMERR